MATYKKTSRYDEIVKKQRFPVTICKKHRSAKKRSSKVDVSVGSIPEKRPLRAGQQAPWKSRRKGKTKRTVPCRFAMEEEQHGKYPKRKKENGDASANDGKTVCPKAFLGRQAGFFAKNLPGNVCGLKKRI